MSTLTRLALATTLGLGLAAQTPAPTAEPAYVVHKDFRSKLFTLKHRDPRELARSLHALRSGAKGAELDANRELSTLSVRDYPENLAAIEEALKRLDVPAAARQEAEFHIHVFFASQGGGKELAYPEEMREVFTALKSTLTYRTYTPAASLVLRAQEGSRGISAKGSTEVELPNPKGEKRSMTLPFVFHMDGFKVETPASGPALLHLDRMYFDSHGVPSDWQIRMASDLVLRDGEKVVVGTTTLKDQGVIVVVTARLIR